MDIKTQRTSFIGAGFKTKDVPDSFSVLSLYFENVGKSLSLSKAQNG